MEGGASVVTTEPWASVDESAKRLGVTRDSLYCWIEREGLVANKVGRIWKLKLSETDARVREDGADVRDDDGEATP